MVLGRRFLLLVHTGRKTGKERRNVLEVMGSDPVAEKFFVMTGWGENSDWWRNV